MNKERMLALADHLEGLPRKRFNMDRFYAAQGLEDSDFVDMSPGAISKLLTDSENACKTSACVAGWAIALWPRAGSRGGRGKWKNGLFGRYYFYDESEHAASILGLTLWDANRLFFEDLNQTPKQAARKIRKSVELGYVPEGKDSE